MSDSNIALKGMLIGIAVVALPVAGFVAGRKFGEDAVRASPPPAVTMIKTVEKACPACPECPPAPTVAATATAPAPTASASAAPSASAPTNPNEGTLVIECMPACVAITLDGKEIGPSPIAGLGLPPGKHKLFAKFAAGQPRLADATIVAGQTFRLSLTPGVGGSREEEPSGPKVGCDPPFWEQEDGTRIMKPACK
jgi:hypothetical protein